MTEHVTSDIIGKTVTFQSKNANDAVVWKGIVTSCMTHTLAQRFSDILSYNAAVQQNDPTVGPIDTLTYFTIDLDNDSGVTVTQVFANAWIVGGSFDIISETQNYNITVYDLQNKGKDNLVNVLRNAGYSAVFN